MTTPQPDGAQQPAPTPNPFAPPTPPRPAAASPWAGPATGPVTEPLPTTEPVASAEPVARSWPAPPRPARAPEPHPGYGVAPAPPARDGHTPPPPPAWPAWSAGPVAPARPATDERGPWAPAPAWPAGAPDEPDDRDDTHHPDGGAVPRRAPRRRRALGVAWVLPLLLLSLLAGGVGGVLADRALGDGRLADAGLPVRAPSDDDGSRPAASVAGIAASVLPSVVSIEVTSAQGRATGSGFVLRQDGYLMTNNHVIAGGAEPGADIRVLFADGSEEPATIVGRTSDYDLAVLKVERTGLDPLLLAESSEVVVGDAVVAIGAPLGLEGTVTTGIVSALNRPVQAGASDQTAFINAIQTDAAINPGNSGGPLVNDAGEVIGINSAIAQPPGGQGASGSIGLGFAIPADQARRTAEELIETGSATYPIIGVLLDESYTGEGVQVAEQASGTQAPVTPGGPAEDAGIRPGDVIVAIDGRPVTEPDELIVAIRAKAPGDTTVLRVRTGDEEREVRVVLDQATSD